MASASLATSRSRTEPGSCWGEGDSELGRMGWTIQAAEKGKRLKERAGTPLASLCALPTCPHAAEPELWSDCLCLQVTARDLGWMGFLSSHNYEVGARAAVSARGGEGGQAESGPSWRVSPDTGPGLPYSISRPYHVAPVWLQLPQGPHRPATVPSRPLRKRA